MANTVIFSGSLTSSLSGNEKFPIGKGDGQIWTSNINQILALVSSSGTASFATTASFLQGFITSASYAATASVISWGNIKGILSDQQDLKLAISASIQTQQFTLINTFKTMYNF